MIKLRSIQHKSEELKKFEKIQWRIANIEHYGKDTWKAKQFIFIAKEKSKLVGFIEFEISAGVCHIQSLLISKDKRRMGIGKELIKKSEDVARKLKSHKIFLSTGKKWDSAKFYESLGYKIEAVFPNHYGHQDFVQQVKFLK